MYTDVWVFCQVLFHGTVVTIENFLTWKAKFELEMAELRSKKQKEEEQGGKLKLTGKLVMFLLKGSRLATLITKKKTHELKRM